MHAGAPTFLCYATSRDGVHWERPELGLVEFGGSKANNIVLATHGDPWGGGGGSPGKGSRAALQAGFVQPARRKPGSRGPPGSGPLHEVGGRQPRHVRLLFGRRDPLEPGGGAPGPRAPATAGVLACDPIAQGYISASRRYNCLMDHFVLEWKKYRRVIALSTSADFVHWTPLKTVLKPDDLDPPDIQLYQMVPFVYGNQYLGILWVSHPTELSAMELASAHEVEHWQRVGRREEFFSVGSPGSWDGGWAACGLSAPALKGDTLYMGYSGKPQGHGTGGNFHSSSAC